MIWPLLLITLGILFLLNNIAPERFEFGRMWPVILIVIGLVKILEYFNGSERPDVDAPGRRPEGGDTRAQDGATRTDAPAGGEGEDG